MPPRPARRYTRTPRAAPRTRTYRPTYRPYRRTGNLSGRGAYWRNDPQASSYSYSRPGPWGQLGQRVGAMIGGTVGGRQGAVLGQAAGGLAHYVGRLFGSGAYRVGESPKFNSLFPGLASKSKASLSFGTEASVRIRKREYIGDVISSSTVSAYAQQQFSINPGSSSTFPWLSQIARKFQTYKFHGCVFEYKSTSANALNSTNTSLGTVIGAVDYNSATQEFNYKQDLLNTYGGIDVKPSDSFFVGVECDPAKLPVNELYVRADNQPVKSDLRFYDQGQFYVASTGCQGTSVSLGEMYVIYDVELMLPISTPPGTGMNTSSFSFFTSGGLAPTSTVWVPNWNQSTYGIARDIITDQMRVASDNIGIICSVAGSGTQIAFPQNTANGIYRMDFVYVGSNTANVVNPTFNFFNGLTLIASSGPKNPDTTSELKFTLVVKVPGIGSATEWSPNNQTIWPYVQLASNTGLLPTSLTYAGMSITQISAETIQFVLGNGNIVA